MKTLGDVINRLTNAALLNEEIRCTSFINPATPKLGIGVHISLDGREIIFSTGFYEVPARDRPLTPKEAKDYIEKWWDKRTYPQGE